MKNNTNPMRENLEKYFTEVFEFWIMRRAGEGNSEIAFQEFEI